MGLRGEVYLDLIELVPSHLQEKKHANYILTCDIGGTYCRFGLVGLSTEKTCDILAFYKHKTSAIAHEHVFTEIVNDFLREIHERYYISIHQFVIAAGGPVHHNAVFLTNHNLHISAEFICQHTMLSDVLIVNDLVGLAYGVAYNQEDAQKLTPHVRGKNSGPILVVAPGTGLGVATIEYDREHPFIIPMEGGHMDFVPYNSFDTELIQFLQAERNSGSPIEFEDFVSGRGIANIFRYLLSLETDEDVVDVVHAKMILQYNSKIIPLLISRYAQTNTLCKKTFDVFFTYLARFCKNLSLANVITGGLYLTGGMIEHNHELLNADAFVMDFVNHTNTRYADMLAQIPIFFIEDSFVGVKGAARALIEKRK